MAGGKRKGPSEPDRVGDLLGGVLARLGISEEVAQQEVLLRWEATVGETIAAVSKAVGISNGVLFVQVASSPWMNELNLMRHDILKRLNAGAGAGRVERIVFSLSDGSDTVDRNPRNR